ncbi:hypothetical protein D3C72_787630 [compost metagenome]
MLECAQHPRYQPGIRDLAGAHDSVESFLDHVHDPIREIQIERDFRIVAHESGQGWHQQHARQRQADPQPTARRLLSQRHLLCRRIDLDENSAAPFQQQTALRRQREAARTAMKKAGAEPALQPRDRLADRGRRHAETMRRPDKTARLGGVHEDVERAEAIHGQGFHCGQIGPD